MAAQQQAVPAPPGTLVLLAQAAPPSDTCLTSSRLALPVNPSDTELLSFAPLYYSAYAEEISWVHSGARLQSGTLATDDPYPILGSFFCCSSLSSYPTEAAAPVGAEADATRAAPVGAAAVTAAPTGGMHLGPDSVASSLVLLLVDANSSASLSSLCSFLAFDFNSSPRCRCRSPT